MNFRSTITTQMGRNCTTSCSGRFTDGKVQTGRVTPGILADELKRQFPEVVYAAGYTGWDANLTFAAGEKINKETGHWAGADWFKMFSIPLLAGTPAPRR